MTALASILDHTLAGQRLGDDEALALAAEAPLTLLGAAADDVRRRKVDARYASYLVDRNVNYTNVCVYRCQFCAFYRPAGASDAYVLPYAEIAAKLEETRLLGGTGVLLQGGVNAELPLAWYEQLFRQIRRDFPGIHLHALSAPEIYFLAKREKMTLSAVLERLIAAGLQSVPGGGAEILDDDVRRRIWSLTKAPAAVWIDVHRQAHRLGLRTTATMMFGVGEEPAARIRHLRAVRDLQDETGGFTAFIPWTFQDEHTELEGKVAIAGGAEYLRLLALSRLYLDNVEHIQGSWVTQGSRIGQLSLAFGADDLGSIMIEENVVAAAGATNRMDRGQIERLIREAGYEPRQRMTLYDACSEPCCRRQAA